MGRFPWDNNSFSNEFKYEVVSYPDGSKYVKIINYSPRLMFRINSYEDLWILAQIKDVLDHINQNVTLTIPNLIDSQADRRFDDKQPHSLKMVCNFINSLKFKEVNIFHPHNPEVVEALIDKVEIVDNSDFIKKVLSHIKHNNKLTNEELQENFILMSSDAGGFKPLMKLCDKIGWQGETYSASKSRKYVDGKSKLIQLVDRDDFQGKSILIVDDICVNGGTFIGLGELLRDRNVGELFLAVSHLTVPNPNPLLLEKYDSIYTTNSKGIDYRVGPLKIIEMF